MLKKQLKSSYGMFFWIISFFIAFVISYISSERFLLLHLSSILYAFLIIVWLLSVKKRVVHKTLQRCLIAGAVFLCALFIIRLCRYDFFDESEKAVRYLWYLFYFPITAVPMISFFCSVSVGRSDEDNNLKKYLWLIILWLIMNTGIATNDIHQSAFIFENPLDYHLSGYTYGWLFYVSVVWIVMFYALAFLILIRKCRLTQCKKYSWIPLIPVVISAVFLIAYALNGGNSPKLFGRTLYQLQEFHMLMFIGFWECCIKIGLIPSNTDYDKIFNVSSIGAYIKNKKGEIVYRSKNAVTEPAEHIKLLSGDIAGGKVFWTHDMTAIDELNESLEDAALRIDEENTLLEEENRIKELQIHFETQNRLYDRIAFEVHGELLQLDEMLNTPYSDEPEFRKMLSNAAIIGAYIKRRTNLMLLAHSAEKMSFDELTLAIRESMEYLKAAGISCYVSSKGSGNIPSENIIGAYSLFEELVIRCFEKAGSLLAYIEAENQRVNITFETDLALQDTGFINNFSDMFESINCNREDGVLYLRLEVAGC